MLEAWLVWLVPLIGAPLVPLVSFFDSRGSKWFAIGVSGLTAAIGLYQALVFSQPIYRVPRRLVDFPGLG